MISIRSIAAIGAAVVQDCSSISPTDVPRTNMRATESRASVVAVAGTGIDHLTSAVVHSTKPTPTGIVRLSTEIVELSGDLNGRVLYHVTTVVDTVHGTLVNTGDQVYSGTVAGSAPVMIHDDRFRFEVDLKTGREEGRVYLFNRIAGPKVSCELHVVGTGMNAQKNPTFTYKGQCSFTGADK